VPHKTHVLATRNLPQARLELRAEDGFTRAVVARVRKRDNAEVSERDVTRLVRAGGMDISDEMKHNVARVVAQLNRSGERESSATLIEGRAPVHGTDAELIWSARPVGTPRRHTEWDASSDFRNLNDTGNVTEGQLLLTIVPATPGTAGRDVFGNVIRPRAGRERTVRRGRNVDVSDDETQYFARTGGRMTYRHGVLSVETVYEITGSVDFSVGNVDFPGPVIVHGDVRSDFEVRSGEWIEVYGTVEAARLTARGDVEIRGGVNGRGKCHITCGGTLHVRYLNGAKVDAAGDVEVVRSVVRSAVRCGGSFRVVTQGVRASRVSAGGNVDIPVVGSRRGVEVVVSAGADVARAQEIESTDQAREGTEKERQRLLRRLGNLVAEPARLAEIAEIERRARMSAMLQRYFKIEKEQARLLRRREELTSGSWTPPDARIKVSRTVFPGALLKVGVAEHHIRGVRHGPIEYLAVDERITVA